MNQELYQPEKYVLLTMTNRGGVPRNARAMNRASLR